MIKNKKLRAEKGDLGFLEIMFKLVIREHLTRYMLFVDHTDGGSMVSF